MKKTLGILGTKVGMTRIFAEDGTSVPVTVIKAGPCPVVQRRDLETDGYQALQVAYDEIPERLANKPSKGHFAKHGVHPHRYLIEFRLGSLQGEEERSEIRVDIFSVGERINVSGVSKGRGFSGVMRRWNFRGAPASHGHEKIHRSAGSVGQCADPGKIFRGKKMPGQLGNKQVTCRNLEIVEIRPTENLVLIKGQIPGPKNGLVTLRKQ